MLRCLSALIVSLSWGCSVLFEPNAVESGDASRDAGVDFGAGSWRLENVSQTTETMGFHARQAFLDDGRRVVAWAEVEAGSSGSDMDVMAAERAANDWSAVPLTDDDQQNSYTDLVSGGDELYLVWSGRPTGEDDHDTFLSIQVDGSWSSPIDLTSSFETEDVRDDYRPRVARTPEGDLVVAYLSRPLSQAGVGIEGEVRVQRVVGGVASSEPVTVIPSSEDACSEVVVASAPSGQTHLVANCGALRYANDSAGTWSASRDVEHEGSGTVASPEIAADERGLHLVYRADIPCGDGDCGEIFYRSGSDAGDFERPIPVTSTPEASDILPTVAIDGRGQLLVAYTEIGEEDDTAFFSYSESGDAFAPPVEISPGDVVTQDRPADITLHPESGLPSIVFLRTFSGSEPLNIDVFAADLELTREL